MKVFQGILAESKEYYIGLEKNISKRLMRLPNGSIKARRISGQKYYYLQQRKGIRVVHKYLGKNEPRFLVRQIKERKILKAELKKIKEVLKIIKRSEGRKNG